MARLSLTGEADGPPMMPGSTTGDAGTGVQMAMAILAAYVQKQRTGVGQRIEVSMQEAMTYYVRTRAFIGSALGIRPAGRPSTFTPASPSGRTTTST